MAVPTSATVLAFWSVAAIAGLVAAVVFLADPSQQGNRWLGIYLGLEAVSFSLIGAQALVEALGLAGEPAPTGGPWAPLLSSVARVISLAGTGALVYLASVFPRHRGVRTNRLAGGMLAVALVGLLGVEALTRGISQATDPFAAGSLAGIGFVVACYLAADVLLLRSFRDEPGGVMGEQVRLVATGVLIATLPWVAILVTRVLEASADRLAGAAPAAFVELLAWPAILWALFFVLLRQVPSEGMPGLRRDQRVPLRGSVALAFAFFTGLWVVGQAPSVWGAAGGSVPAGLEGLPALAALFTLEVRWAVLGGFLLLGAARGRALGVDESVVRRSLAVVGAIGAFGIVGATGAILGPWWGAGLAAGLVAALPFLTARLRRPVQARPDLRERRLAAYQDKLREALDGAVDEDELEDARRRLRIRRAEHEVLAAVVEVDARDGGRLGERFEVIERVGAGGSGTVYRVRDEETGETAALKRLHPGVDPRIREDGRSELEVARRVSHPNVVAVHEVLDLDRGAAILLEDAPGGALADRLADEGALEPEEAAHVLAQALDGLAALHEAGVAHGDVKPANLLLDAEDRVKVADFGIARAGEAERTRTGDQTPGTPAYMAPEQHAGEPASPASDVYGAGATGLRLLTGTADPEEGLDRVPEDWRAWLSGALAEPPGERYADAAEMGTAMREHGLAGEAG